MDKKITNSVTIIGWLRTGKPADCGESIKNRILINRLEELGVRCREIDFKQWKKRPWIFLKFAYIFLTHSRDTLIMATSAINLTLILKLNRLFRLKRNTVFWVIGGAFADDIENGRFCDEDFKYIKHIIVESDYMQSKLEKAGFNNVTTVQNFKPIKYYPQLSTVGSVFRFVFISRIVREKGCDYILEAVERLNQMGYDNKFIVDFYGKIDDSYSESFNSSLQRLGNIRYKGFVDMSTNAGYDNLASYNVMLFPTFWPSEGFAGVFVDSFISGVPMIASDWSHNCEFLENGKTAMIVPTHNVDALTSMMRKCIDGDVDLLALATNCQNEAKKYDVRNLVDNDLLRQIGILM
jgi:glycosyltransferase involved in cell wall biosynthesis